MPVRVISSDEMRAVEEYWIGKLGVPSSLLMESAGRFVCDEIVKHCGEKCRTLVVCGKGNNAGDGFVCARYLKLAGHEVTLALLSDPEFLSGDAALMYSLLMHCKVNTIFIDSSESLSALSSSSSTFDVIVDAIFGIGLNRNVEGPFYKAIEWMNHYSASYGATKIFSVDIPSGTCADTGNQLPISVNAHYTITFNFIKLGHLLFPGRSFAGALTSLKIFPDDESIFKGKKSLELMMPDDLKISFPARDPNAHKGSFGRALLVAGSAGLAGAAIMCAKSALRSGVGLLNVATSGDVAHAMWSALPEAMSSTIPMDSGVISKEHFETFINSHDNISAAAIGPGLGTSERLVGILEILLNKDIPLVIDADALTLLSRHMSLLSDHTARIILTPHLGEMAKLTKSSIDAIRENPISAARELAEKANCVVLLKGATSVIADCCANATLNISGGPKLAKGGSGDVLTGIILALLARGLSTYDAARHGALLLGLAADECAVNEHSALSSDIVDAIPAAIDRYAYQSR